MLLLQSKKGAKGRKLRRRLLWAILAVLVVGAWLAFEPARERYRHWKGERALKQAKAFIEKHDAPNAQLALEVAMTAAPGNAETIRVAADMLEQVGAPQAMRLRRAVVQLQPKSTADAAKLVLCCLKFGDYNAARDALSAIPEDRAGESAALHAALAYALATGNRPVADALFQELEKQVPKNEDLKTAHTILYLRHPNPEKRAQAQAELERISAANPAAALQIRREFVSAALERRDYPEAKKWLSLIVADPGALFTDRLQKANIDLIIDRVPFEKVFAELAPRAGGNEADATQFGQWLLLQRRAPQVDTWLKGLSEAIRQAPALQGVRADVAAQLSDWDLLGQLLSAGAWGNISNETVRLALAARTVDTPARPALRHDTWDLALGSAGGSLSSLRVLQRLASIWGWEDERERTLWMVARTFPAQTWAHQQLFDLYRSRKDTANMRAVTAALRDAEGSVPRYQHDWALLTLLLEPSNNWTPAKDVMRGLHEGDPHNPNYATGYAFALAQVGKGPEALAVVEKMTAQDREYLPRQPYLAFVYGVAKKTADYERVTALGKKGDYLPEESYLFTKGKEELTRKPAPPLRGAKPAPSGQLPAPSKP